MTTKLAVTKNLWAPIVKAKRGNDWAIWTCVASTRKEAKRKFLEDLRAENHKAHLARVRFARVTITEQEAA